MFLCPDLLALSRVACSGDAGHRRASLPAALHAVPARSLARRACPQLLHGDGQHRRCMQRIRVASTGLGQALQKHQGGLLIGEEKT
jgi:hypothetical protein